MKLKRVLSLLLAMVMTVSLLTLPVHAEGNDFASLTVAEQYAALKSADNEAEAQALFDTLTEQQQTALVTYAQTQAEQEYTVPQTVVFTEAGPFMPPVNVAPVRMKTMARAAVVPAEDDGNGLEFTKKATANGNGTYTITMEAYTTGKVTASTKTIPVDIVLVLDQSGSMAYNFNGNSTGTNSARRQYAMKQAVNNFILAVNEKYSAEADHRMAIVTFGSSASTLQGWTYVDETGKTALQGKINNLPNSPSGATNVAAGMTQAEALMGSGYNYTGTNKQRQKVVIVFTDGVPTTQTNFNVDVANAAIGTAKTMKDAGVTIYSVGIFTGANPNKIHGDYYYRAVIADTPCDGSVNSYWGTTNLSSSNENDFADPDIPAGNRFLNYISNNYNATEIGLSFSSDDGVLGGYKWTITKNFDRVKSEYYLTADNSTSLNNIFQTISEQIQTANIDLGSETVVKDKISPYFTAPANASAINLYTADYDGSQFGERKKADGVTAIVEGDTVSVKGFDYNANFVSSNQKSDKTYGKKLIIEFTVTPRDGFLGGNNVPTNDKAAVYDKDGAMVKAEESPLVDVPIKPVTVTAADKNVYLTGNLTEDQLMVGATVKCGDVDITNPDNLQSWQKAYVNINITASGLQNLTNDTTYTVNATVSPNNTSGTAVEQTGSATANIYVFNPEVNFKDSTIYRGNTADYSNNQTDTPVWKHGNKVDTAVDMIGTAPTLTYTYGKDEGAFENCTDVNVTVKIGSTDVTDKTTGDKQFTVHVLQPTITATINDVERYYGESYTLGNGANGAINLTWTDKNHNQNSIPDVTGTMPYNKTNLSLAYSANAFSGQTGTVPASDFDVTVKVMKGDEVMPATITTTCTYGCGVAQTDEYTVHVKTCTLTITKSGCDTAKDAYQSFIFNVSGPKTMQVTVQENGTAKIVGLPVGDYTVTEDGNWSWRYTAKNAGNVTLSAAKHTDTVTITNTRTATKWLSGDNYAVNHVGGIKARGTFVGA